MTTKAIYHPAYRNAIARLKQARLDHGLTQDQVADRLGRHRAWVAKVELCEIKLDVLTFVRYCRAVGVSATKLVAEIEEGLEEDPFFLPIPRRRIEIPLRRSYGGTVSATPGGPDRDLSGSVQALSGIPLPHSSL